jgi:hypothetical protein
MPVKLDARHALSAKRGRARRKHSGMTTWHNAVNQLGNYLNSFLPYKTLLWGIYGKLPVNT